jgi:hypothetical protein
MSHSFGVNNLKYDCTGNMHPFWDKFIEHDIEHSHYEEGEGEITYHRNRKGIHALEGLKGYEAIPVIKEFFVRCRNYHNNLANDYDSENGWGTVETCIVLMGQLLVDCIEEPYKRIWVQ